MECKYCKKILSTKTSLITHQSKAQYCLDIQKQSTNIDTNEIAKKFKCDFCDKEFMHNHNKTRHEETCKLKIQSDKIKKENEVEKKENEYKIIILKLEEKIKLLETDSEKKIDNIIHQYKEKIKLLETDSDTKLNNMKHEYNNKIYQYEEKNKLLETDSQKKIDNIRYEYEKKITDQTIEYERKINAIEVKYEKEISKIHDDLRNIDHTFILNQSDKLSSKPTISKQQTTVISNRTKIMSLTRLDLSTDYFKTITDVNTYSLAHYTAGVLGQACWILKYITDNEGKIMYAGTNKTNCNFAHVNNEGIYSTDEDAAILKGIIKNLIGDRMNDYNKLLRKDLEFIDNNDIVDKVFDLKKENMSQKNLGSVLISFLHADASGFPKLDKSKLEEKENYIQKMEEKRRLYVQKEIEKTKRDDERLRENKSDVEPEETYESSNESDDSY